MELMKVTTAISDFSNILESFDPDAEKIRKLEEHDELVKNLPGLNEKARLFGKKYIEQDITCPSTGRIIRVKVPVFNTRDINQPGVQ